MTTPGLSENQKTFLELAAKHDDIERGDPRLKDAELSQSYVDRPDKIETKIANRAESVPSRVDRLLMEVSQLGKARHLHPGDLDITEEDRDELWDEYLELYQGDHGEELPLVTERSSLHRGDSLMSSFGERLGEFAGILTFIIGEPNICEIRRELVVGFLRGLDGQIPATAMDPSGNRELAKLLEDRAEMIEEGPDLDDIVDQPGPYSEEYRPRLEDHFENILQDHGIEPTEWMISRLESDHSFMPTNKDMIEFEAEETAFEGIAPSEEKVMEVFEKGNVGKRNRLQKTLAEDWKALQDVTWDGFSAPDVLLAFNDEAVTIRQAVEYAAEANNDLEKANAIPAFGKLLKYLSGDTMRGLEKWDGAEIFELKELGRIPQWEVTLTDYGLALQQYKGCNAVLPTGRALKSLSDEEVQSALDQIG